MPDIVNFTLLVPGYFHTPFAIIELCFGTQFSYLETVLFLEKARGVFNWWLIFPHLLRHCPSDNSSLCSIYHKVFPLWLVEIRTLPGSVSAPRMVLLLPMVLFLALDSFLTWMHWLYSAEVLRVTTRRPL